MGAELDKTEQAFFILDNHRDTDGFETGDHITRVVHDHHEISSVSGDCLEVRFEPGQFRHRGFLRIVRLVIDGYDLLSRSNGEEDFGRRWRQRNDVLGLRFDGHWSVRSVDRDGEP